jgi:hypothetical protein
VEFHIAHPYFHKKAWSSWLFEAVFHSLLKR